MNANTDSPVPFLIVISVFLAILVAGHLWHKYEMEKNEKKKVTVEK